MPEPIGIRVKDITKTFRGTKALDHVTLDFETGLMHGVIGPEGAGKTTLMRLILGLLHPVSGTIEYSEGRRPISYEDLRPHIAYMPQQHSLYADLSIDEHLEFFRTLYSIPDGIYKTKREELLRMTQLTRFADRPAGQLSGGMYKKLGLMCALLRSPRALILDEPTNCVDPISRREFWEMLYRLADQKILILVTTSYMDEAERCARVHLIEKGEMVATGEPRALLAREQARSFDELFLRQARAVSLEAIR